MRRRARGSYFWSLATITTGFGVGAVGGLLGKAVHSWMADLSDS
jgi:hypothetical protein